MEGVLRKMLHVCINVLDDVSVYDGTFYIEHSMSTAVIEYSNAEN